MTHAVRSVTFGGLVLPNEPWPDLVSRWRRLEDGGVDTIWSCDHFTNPHRVGQTWFEGWTGLAALAALTPAFVSACSWGPSCRAHLRCS